MDRFTIEDLTTTSYTLPTGALGLLNLTSEPPRDWNPVAPVGDWDYLPSTPTKKRKVLGEIPAVSPSQKTPTKKTKNESEAVLSSPSKSDIHKETSDIPTGAAWDALLLEWEEAVPFELPQPPPPPPPPAEVEPSREPTPPPPSTSLAAGQVHTCALCGKEYTVRKSLTAHWRRNPTHSPLPPPRPAKPTPPPLSTSPPAREITTCAACGKEHTTRKQLTDHWCKKPTHRPLPAPKGPYIPPNTRPGQIHTCASCGKEYTTRKKLTDHWKWKPTHRPPPPA